LFTTLSTKDRSLIRVPNLSLAEKLERGTKIILTLKEDSAEFADNRKLKKLVKTYSEFITFPIKVWTETQVPEEVVNVEATAAAQKEKDEAAEKEGKEPEKVKDVMKTNFNDVSSRAFLRQTKEKRN
jgi:HSP90 family molecular chaperone